MIQYKRLEKLAKYLSYAKLPSGRKFDFSQINDDKPQLMIKGNRVCVVPGSCGSAGCAMGELPFCFPKDWKYPEPELKFNGDTVEVMNSLHPMLKGTDDTNALDFADVAGYFGVSEGVVSDLFDFGHSNRTSIYGGFKLPGVKTTSQEVAKNIRTFIKWAKSSRTNAQKAMADNGN